MTDWDVPFAAGAGMPDTAVAAVQFAGVIVAVEYLIS
jgi:hypothetical protein